MSTTQHDKAKKLQQLHQGPGILVLPNAWDAGSACIFESCGFPAIGTSSAGVAATLGYPDGQVVPRDEAMFLIKRICSSVSVPVTADIEAGYGENSVDEVVKTAQQVLLAGAVGVNLEDSAEGGITLTDIELQREKIAALRRLAIEMGTPFVINARTDAFHITNMSPEEQFQEAVIRLNSYFSAGADCLFAPFLTNLQLIAKLVEAVDGPLNILATAVSPSIAELDHAGVRRVSIGGGPYRAALGLARKMALELRDHGTYTLLGEYALQYAELKQLLMQSAEDHERANG